MIDGLGEPVELGRFVVDLLGGEQLAQLGNLVGRDVRDIGRRFDRVLVAHPPSMKSGCTSTSGRAASTRTVPSITTALLNSADSGSHFESCLTTVFWPSRSSRVTHVSNVLCSPVTGRESASISAA